MATPDMDVIKEIPGYKVILKAVLKSQIQQLVEQLASHTDEESVILTASVSDGTLSHLGSDSGKYFLQDHEDMKSQFLGFCLKRHHRKKQEKEREEEMQRMSFSQKTSHFPSPPPRQGLHPTSLTRTSPGSHNRPVGVRHEPYPVSRPRRSLNLNPQIQSPTGTPSSMVMPTNSQVVKLEPEDESSNQSAGDSGNLRHRERTGSQPTSPSHAQTSSEKFNKDSNNDSDSTVPNEASDLPFRDSQPAPKLGLDSDFSNLISGEQSTSSTDQLEDDPNVKVKLEAISESNMELEITGVEPGRGSVSSQDSSWAQMGYELSGATGSPADLQGQEGFISKKKYPCQWCGMRFDRPSKLDQHIMIHTGERPYVCKICGKAFNRKGNLKAHSILHIGHLVTTDN